MEKSFTRSPAKKIRIVDLINGKYFYGSREEMKPSYVITPFGEKVSRVNVIASVVEKFVSEDGSYSSVTVDDGTESIRVKSFGEPSFRGIEPGNLVRVIGKMKEYNGELYVNLESINKVNDVNFEILSKLEILQNLIKQKKIVDDIRSMSNQIDEEELKGYARENYSVDEETLSAILDIKKKETDYKPVVLEIIEKLDEGKGVEISKLFEVLNLPDNLVERTIDELIDSGSVYEPTVGFLKKV
ncbi:MAG: hypothetical protein HYW24_04425 [Candidatus Aenigmarchaeota archaeon]|nr:hypothetical protein [Candidatus Aenigmarchaeota archaeon]